MINFHKKPTIISILENTFGQLFAEVSELDVRKAVTSGLSYSVGENGEPNGLAIVGYSVTDISPFLNLNLKQLNLNKNAISDLGKLEDEHTIEYLFLGENRIFDTSPLKEVPNLRELALFDNPIGRIETLASCPFIDRIYFQRTNVRDLSFLTDLKNLIILYAGENLIEDIEVLGSLPNLEVVLLQNNLIKNIDALVNLKQLTSVNLSNNLITNIPLPLAEILDWKLGVQDKYRPIGLQVQGNPLHVPPISVVELGADVVLRYYDDSTKFSRAQLLEGRIIVIGHGDAGKSSLIAKLLYNEFELGRAQTNGIKIDEFNVQHNGCKVSFHIWDFGGQEIQHAFHKFFFTEGCLYILVLDNRREEDPEYWLQQIESLAAGSSVIVVLNKHDENTNEIADRKYLREKYPNIVAYCNTSCKDGFGISDFKSTLSKFAVQLKTVEEQFPNNWIEIKSTIEDLTCGSGQYLDYKKYAEICADNSVNSENTQRLLLKYFTTVGSVTWFGDTYLNFLHILNPSWITQGVYKIITSSYTRSQRGRISIDDFPRLLISITKIDNVYQRDHYPYILSVMKKFELCYSPDDKDLFIPSAFETIPKVEYAEFRGDTVRIYILQFNEYLPIGLIHRFIAKNIADAYDNNYWYSGIVIRDRITDNLVMVHLDKGAGRIYIKIKSESPLGIWEHIRRQFAVIAGTYAKIPYEELISLDNQGENTVSYTEVISHLRAQKYLYFHSKLRKDFSVGHLLGFFQTQHDTIEKIKKGEIRLYNEEIEPLETVPQSVIQIVNNISPQITNQINIDINISVINDLSSELKGDTAYLLEEVRYSNQELKGALERLIQFANDSKLAQNSSAIKEKGWGRKLKSIIEILSKSGEQLKHIREGGEVLKNIIQKVESLCSQFNLHDVIEFIHHAKY